MRYKLFNGDWNLSHKFAIFSLTTNVVLSVALTGMVMKNLQQHERVVVGLTTVNKAFEIQWNAASTESYKDMAVWISGMIGQVNATNVDRTITTINRFLAPNIQKQVAESLHGLVAYLPSKTNYSSWFLPVDVVYEQTTRKIFVTGHLTSAVTTATKLQKQVTYEFKFIMDGGQPVVTHFTSYDGGARTDKYLRLHKQKIQKSEQAEAQFQRDRDLQLERQRNEEEFNSGTEAEDFSVVETTAEQGTN